MLNGLDMQPLDFILDFIQEKFNVVRIPFSVKSALSPLDTMPQPGMVAFGLEGKTSWEILDLVIGELAKRGVLVMLDMHNIDAPAFSYSELW